MHLIGLVGAEYKYKHVPKYSSSLCPETNFVQNVTVILKGPQISQCLSTSHSVPSIDQTCSNNLHLLQKGIEIQRVSSGSAVYELFSQAHFIKYPIKVDGEIIARTKGKFHCEVSEDSPQRYTY